MSSDNKTSYDFQLKLKADLVNVKVIVLEYCYILYVGRKNEIDVMTMGNFGRSTLLNLTPGVISQNYVENFNLKLSKVFQGKQIFVNTDLSMDDTPEFWSDLFIKIVPKLKEVLSI
uniref:Nfu_N domain-containing protein n=1 Tax=Parastrongyloides trichosuri TaxID=131310 RepID=A0A0N4ZYY9_PARTI